MSAEKKKRSNPVEPAPSVDIVSYAVFREEPPKARKKESKKPE